MRLAMPAAAVSLSRRGYALPWRIGALNQETDWLTPKHLVGIPEDYIAGHDPPIPGFTALRGPPGPPPMLAGGGGEI